jgi:hypothetical protein
MEELGIEEEYDTPDPEFVKGFNQGYLLAKHLPDLAEQLGQAVGSNSEHATGLQAGRDQLLSEQRRERFPAWLRGDYTKEADTGPDHTPEPDMEPDL